MCYSRTTIYISAEATAVSVLKRGCRTQDVRQDDFYYLLSSISAHSHALILRHSSVTSACIVDSIHTLRQCLTFSPPAATLC